MTDELQAHAEMLNSPDISIKAGKAHLKHVPAKSTKNPGLNKAQPLRNSKGSTKAKQVTKKSMSHSQSQAIAFLGGLTRVHSSKRSLATN